MESTDLLAVVQFLHPGGQYDEVSGTCWNAGEHRRRFMVASGIAIDPATKLPLERQPLYLWGEWEPGGRVEASFNSNDARMPRYAFAPTFCAPPVGKRQNTDPLVFGSDFYYTNCRQGSPTGKIKRLAARSIILFGSHKAGDFCLDTLLVVRDSVPYTLRSADHDLAVYDSHILSRAVVEPLRSEDRDADPRFRAYRGVRWEPGSPCFSFVPCTTPERHPTGFPRPAISLPGKMIRQGMTQRYNSTELTDSELQSVWESVVRQVKLAGCLLGVGFDVPE